MFTDVFLKIIKIQVRALRNKPWFSWEPLKEMSHGLLPDPHGADLLSSEEKLCCFTVRSEPFEKPSQKHKHKNEILLTHKDG